jgi:predicted 3-demethylubiquinone-9 3-methyltransferase (glyoxalase superfamily)
MRSIHPCLWFDTEAEEAVQYYVSLFENAKVTDTTRYTGIGSEIHGKHAGEVMTVGFELDGEKFTALNGGPHFSFTPAISLFVVCESAAEVDRLWRGLEEGGQVLMPLDKYGWSDRYGWVQDRFGLSWQVFLGKYDDVGQKITPCFLFVGKQQAKAEEAVHFYASGFKPSKITGILHYGDGEEGPKGTVKHAQFSLRDNVFMAMDSHLEHDFSFNEAFSLVVECETQEEVDCFWRHLSDGGEIQQCGWLKDRYGVSWQVVPKILFEMLGDHDSPGTRRVTEAMLRMKKLEIAGLKKAYTVESDARQ